MYAKIKKTSGSSLGGTQSTSWQDLDWTESELEAGRFSESVAKRLEAELNETLQGNRYIAERDSSGGTNRPPYFSKNWVVRKKQAVVAAHEHQG